MLGAAESRAAPHCPRFKFARFVGHQLASGFASWGSPKDGVLRRPLNGRVEKRQVRPARTADTTEPQPGGGSVISRHICTCPVVQHQRRGPLRVLPPAVVCLKHGQARERDGLRLLLCLRSTLARPLLRHAVGCAQGVHGCRCAVLCYGVLCSVAGGCAHN